MKKKGTFKRLLRELDRDRIPLVFSFIFAAVSVAASLLVPVTVGETIDSFSGGVDMNAVIRCLVKIAVLAAVSALFRWIVEAQNSKIACRVVKNLRHSAYTKLSKLPVSYFDSKPKGETLSRIINDTEAVSDGLLMGMSQLFYGIVTIIGTLIFMFGINVRITFIVILLTPLSLVAAFIIAKSTYKLFLAQSEKKGAETAFLSESLKNIKLQKAFNREGVSCDDFNKITDELASSAKKAIFASSLTNPTTRFVGAVIYAVLGLFGAFAVIGGGLTVGGLTCFLSYAGQYSKPFNEISGVVSELQNSFACASRVFDLLDMEETEKTDGKSGEKLEKCRGEIVFDNVSFSYDKNKKLLQNVSFTAHAGEKIAIVGPTGCGKTTLINLLMRFYDIDSGRITIDGADISTLDVKDLRRKFGMVLQDTFLFDASIKDNITIGKPDATIDEVMEAARKSHAHKFISRLPDGYGTILSESAAGLSEGERQLLSITRVMLSLPPVLILDEATSSIDTRTEMKINDAFSVMMKGRTSFIVAHRLSTVVNADMILVMKDGNIIEKGTHSELMEKGGFYKELFESQFSAV